MKSSLIFKVVEIFRIYPKKINAIDSMVNNINKDLPEGIEICYDAESLVKCSISLKTEYGSFFKSIDYIEDGVHPYQCSFYFYTTISEPVHSGHLSRDDANTICQCMIKILCSKGKHKGDLPLICNMYSEMFIKILNQEFSFDGEQYA